MAPSNQSPKNLMAIQYIFTIQDFSILILFLGLVETFVVEYFFIIPDIVMLCLANAHLLFWNGDHSTVEY